MARTLKIVFVLCALVPLVISQCSMQTAEIKFRRSVYEFSVELLRRIAEDTEGHFVASTLSPWTLLSAIALGANGDTLQQIKVVLKHHPHRCFNTKYLEIAKDISSGDKSATLERSSALFIDDTMGLKDAFKNRLIKTGICEISPLSFRDFSAAASHINGYVKNATHGIIDEIITPGDLEGAFLIMVDALYFKGTWRKAFSPEDTEISTFYDTNMNAIGDVNLMFTIGQFNVSLINQIQGKVLELPYGENGRFSMLIFLPNNGVPLLDMVGSLKNVTLRSVFSSFERIGTQKVLVQLPKFKITTDLDNLKELLIDMGIRDMFDTSRASFQDLSDYQLHVSSFIQKADIEVTEEGTVAASATEVTFSFRSSIQPVEFLANRPFLFMVVDRTTEVPVFSGAYSKPSFF